MIIANQEIAVHIKTIRNLTGYTSGRFALRISFESPSQQYPIQSVPVNIVERQQPKSQNRSEFDDRYFISRTFLLKSGLNIELNEVCLFKVNSPIYNNGDEDFQLIMVCELVHVEQSKNRVIDTYKGRLYGLSIHEYLEMDFYEAAPCQIVGSVHSCNYKYDFKVEDEQINLKTYCEKYCKFGVQDLLSYLQGESVRNYNRIAENYTIITKKHALVSYVEPEKIEKSIKTQKSQKTISLKVIDKEEEEGKATSPTEVDEDAVTTMPAMGEKKKRRRIFGITQEARMLKYETCEKILHEYTQKIYEFWREIMAVLLKQQGDAFVLLKSQGYRKKLREKVGESIARFKGSWDIDIYCDQQQLRAKMAYQLRNQDKQFFKDMKTNNSDQFPVVNEAFFSNLRPIFFEEAAVSKEYQHNVQPIDILVIMVHGLGACRLDMEKIKVELRRYYDKRIRVYISTSNEGRTEGDIDNMGMRLATEVQYELSKFQDIPSICMLGHSMGGVIIRTALPRLQKFKRHFHSFITLSSPHLGYAYSTSKLVDAGLWLMNAMKKCTSILQLTMQDSENLEETFLYKLSQKHGLEWFKKIVLLASHQDLYVPYYSARIQKHEESSLDFRKNVKKGVVYCEMIDAMLSKCKGEIIRLNVNFCIPQQNLDNLIGRAAHISFINNVEMVRTFILAGPHYFF